MIRTRFGKLHTRGFTLLYAVVATVALLGVLSLAVDLGRVQCAKTELQNAADAAARYAATGLSNGTTLAKAQSAASENKVDGSALAIQAGDVQTGTWNSTTRVFTATASNPNAVRITAVRSAARGNALPLLFGRVVGASQVNLTATAIALMNASSPSPGVVGLSGVTLTGSAYIRRHPSETGTVTVASNGTYNMSWGHYIYGDVLYRGTAPNPPGSGITGTKTLMGSNIAYATPTTPGGATPMGAATISSGSHTVGGGTFSCTSLTVGGGAYVDINGNVDIYCSGPVNIGNGATLDTNGTTYKLTIYMTNSSTVTLNTSSNLYIRIVAPLSTVNIQGSTPYIGSVVANQLNVASSISYDADLPIPVAASGGSVSGGSSGAITLVE